MKDYIINKTMLKFNISNNEKVKYGLEVIYTSLTKLLFLITISIFAKGFKITIYSIILISILRCFSYGVHMDNSSKCYIFSFIIFVLIPIFFVNFQFYYKQVIFIFIFCLISFILFSPSDTHKRPLINRKKAKILKILSIIILVLYFFFYIFSKILYFKNLILYATVIQSILINPIIYKLFKLPYENFKEVII